MSTAGTVALRPIRLADAPLLFGWRREESVRRHQPLHDLTLEQIEADVGAQELAALYRGESNKFQWIVLVEGVPAGWVTLVIQHWEHGLAELGYTLGTAYQGRGVMPRALELLLWDLFTRTRLERIEARCSVANLASVKVLERLGFRREGTLRSYLRQGSERIDNYLYAALKPEFLARRLA